MPGSDFNGDGRDDILWRNMQDHTYSGSYNVIPRGTITNWLATPSGGFVSNDANAWRTQTDGLWRVVGTGDFNGDGRDDLLWSNQNGTFTEWLGQANGGFLSNDANAWSVLPTSWRVVGTGDFNRDGIDDVLWRNDDGRFTSWLANSPPGSNSGPGNGGFQSNDLNSMSIVPTSWQVAGTGDFNGDGWDDVLWRRDDGAFTEWLGQDNGRFSSNDANAWHDIPTSWKVVGTGDFNGDDRDDVLWRRDDGAFTEWLGQQNGGFVSNDTNAWHTVPTSWQVAGTGDFNGDGRDDVAWRNQNGTFTTWSGQANGGFLSNDANAMSVVPDFWLVDINGHAEADYWAIHGWWDY